ncbi:MAG: C/D box methylation guide ribonucleoprotein complex aNOP56 subunit [Candidatus Heimdallarchaeota archaeon]
MKLYLVSTMIGSFLLDEEGNTINVRYYNLDPEEVSIKLNKLDQEELPEEISELLKEQKDDEIIVQLPKLSRIISATGLKVTTDYESSVIDSFNKNILETVINTGLFKNEQEYRSFIRDASIQLTRLRVRQAAEKRDRLIVQAIETIDDLDKTLNLFTGRLREFYGMHFPELGDAVENHQTLALIISQSGDKSAITKKLLVDEIKFPEKKAERLLNSREKSMGSDLLKQDIQIIKDQAQLIVELYQRRQALEKWMDEAMMSTTPNICGVVGPLLGARLIALVGSLRALAMATSSKIQILGAEKALYRTIKTGAPPPKHGIIFQDSRINQAKWWQRGKIARVISGRISIAARLDFFEAEDQSEQLAKDLEGKINAILEKYPEPGDKRRPQARPQRQFSERSGKPRKPRPKGYDGKKKGGNRPSRR